MWDANFARRNSDILQFSLYLVCDELRLFASVIRYERLRRNRIVLQLWIP